MAHIIVWIIVIVAVVYIIRRFYKNTKEGKCSCCSEKDNCRTEKSKCTETKLEK